MKDLLRPARTVVVRWSPILIVLCSLFADFSVPAARAAATGFDQDRIGVGWFRAHHREPRPGDRFRYQVTLRAQLTIDQLPVVTLDLASPWIVTVVSTPRDGGLTVHAVMEEPAVELHSPNGASDSVAGEWARIRQHFATSHYLVIGADGAVVETMVPADTASLVQTTLKSIAGFLQVVRREPQGPAWNTVEHDASGRYSAAYSFDPDARTAVKTKQRYLELSTEAGLTSPDERRLEVVASRSAFTWDEAGELRGLAAREHLRFSGSSTLPESESSTELTIRWTGFESGAAAPPPEDRLYASALYESASGAALGYEQDLVKSGELTLEDALHVLSTTSPRNEQDKAARSHAFVALVSILRIDPSALEAAVRRIETGDEHARTLVAALGYGSSASAQQALARILSTLDAEDPLRLSILRALSHAREPSEESVAVLIRHLEDPAVGEQAFYGLGSLAHWLREPSPERSARIVERLAETLELAADRRDKVLALRALGNAGHPAGVEVSARYLEDPDPEVRAAAIESLRLLPADDRVGGLLAQRARSDKDPAVLRTLAWVLEARPEPLADQLLQEIRDPGR